ncbi:MAG: putative metal-binding motif-containing protein [Myxococcales bacterium]|nr:putative metal-binding motif-containing protein [Myxococcales bacterium]
MRARLGLIGALVLYAPLLGCGILGFGADIPVSCNDGPRTCADLNDSNPTGQACTFWACIDNRCRVVPKDTDQDGVLDNGCEPEGNPQDCDENDNRRFPGNTEICDYIDNNCNDDVDEGFAYGVAEPNIWPFSDAGITDPIKVSFATRSTEQGATLAATFDYYGTVDPQEGGLAVWSSPTEAPNPFRIFQKRIADNADGTTPGDDTWLTSSAYYNMLPVIADNDLGIVAAATYSGVDRYFAGLVQSEPTETLVRIHEDFHEYDPLWALGEHSNYAAAAWTERGLLVVGIKSCSSACYPSGLSNRDVFVHLLKKDDDTQAWTAASSSIIDHHGIGKVSTMGAAPVIIGLPSGSWLSAHVQDSPDEIWLTLIKLTNEATGDIESSLLAQLPSAHDLALSVGPSEDDMTTIALSYVTANNRAHVKLLSLAETPTPKATELVTIDAPIEDGTTTAHTKPLVTFHSELAEWLFVWRDDTRRLGMMRLSQDGTVIPNTFTHALAQEGRVLDQGFGVVPLKDPVKERDGDSGAYALVTYAKDNTASVFLTGAVDCGNP